MYSLEIKDYLIYLLIGKFGASFSNGIWFSNGLGLRFSKRSGVSSRPVFENPPFAELLVGPVMSKLGSPEGLTSKSPMNGVPPLTSKLSTFEIKYNIMQRLYNTYVISFIFKLVTVIL